MNALEQVVNVELTNLRLVERLLHEREGWTAQYGTQVVPAQVIAADHALVVWASFNADPAATAAVMLIHNGVLCGVRSIDVPESGPFEFELTFEPELRVAA